VSDAGPVYFEKRSALPWTRMVAGLLYLTVGVVAALISFVLSLTVSRAIFLVTFVAVWWDVFWPRYLRSAWPTGIWVDEAGIRIGDVRALPYATSASQTVFTCSWSAVSRVVVTGRSRRRGPVNGVPTWLRWLLVLVPFSRAVVVIYADRNGRGGPRGDPENNLFSFGTPPARWPAPHPAARGAAGRPGTGTGLPCTPRPGTAATPTGGRSLPCMTSWNG
jgi:hypothetical protein